MGRYYKTSKPEMIDFMYKIPEQAILGAIQGTNQQLAQQEQYLTDYMKQLKVDALSWDEEKKNAKLKEYEKEIKDRAYNIYNDPMSALKEKGLTRELGQKLHEDLTRGELFAYQSNYNTRQNFYKEAVKQATDKQGRINTTQVEEAMAAFDSAYGSKQGAQYDPVTGKYNTYGTQQIVDFVDESNYAKQTAEGWESNKTEKWKSTTDGLHWKKQTRSYDILGLNDLTMGIYNTMMHDEKLKAHRDQRIHFQATNIANRTGRDYNDVLKELQTKYYGERDETGQFVMEPVLDENGKQKINKETGKPQMRIKNPGELYRIAMAAADKKDKYDVKEGDDYLGVNQYGLERAKLKNQKAFHDYTKTPIIWDTNNKEFIENPFGTKTADNKDIKTAKDVENKLFQDKQILNSNMNTYKNTLLAALSKGKSKEEIEKISAQLESYFTNLTVVAPGQLGELKVDFDGLKSFAVSLGLGLGDETLTSIDEYEKSFKASMTNIKNKENMFSIIKNEALINLPSGDKIAYVKYQEAIEAEKRKLGSNLVTPERRKEVETQIKYLEEQQENILNKHLTFDPTVKGNANTISRTSYQSAGNIVKEMNLQNGEELANLMQKALGDLAKEPIFSILGAATNTKVRNDKGDRMVNLEGTTFMKYFNDTDNFTMEYNEETGEYTAKSKSEKGKVVFKGKIGNYRVAIDDFEEVGQQSVSTTFTGWQEMVGPDGKKEMKPVTYDIFIPASELQNSEVKKALSSVKDELDLAAVRNKAKDYSKRTGNNPNYRYEVNDYMTILPSAGNGGVPLYEFRLPRPDGTVLEIKGIEDGEEALKYFKMINQ